MLSDQLSVYGYSLIPQIDQLTELTRGQRNLIMNYLSVPTGGSRKESFLVSVSDTVFGFRI